MPRVSRSDKWGAAVQWGWRFSYARCISSRDLLYNIVPIANDAVLCTWKFKKVDHMLGVFTMIKRLHPMFMSKNFRLFLSK